MKKQRLLLLLLIVCFLLAGSVAYATNDAEDYADGGDYAESEEDRSDWTIDDYRDELDDINSHIDELEAEIAAQKTLIADTTKDIASLDAQLITVNQQLALTQKQLDLTTESINKLQAEIDELQAQLAVEVLDGGNIIKHLFKALIQKPLVRILLDLYEIRHFKDFLLPCIAHPNTVSGSHWAYPVFFHRRFTPIMIYL